MGDTFYLFKVARNIVKEWYVVLCSFIDACNIVNRWQEVLIIYLHFTFNVMKEWHGTFYPFMAMVRVTCAIFYSFWFTINVAHMP